MSYQDRLASCKAQLEKVSKDYINSLELEDEDFDDSLESSRTNYVKGVQDLLEVVEEAQQSNAVDLEDIVKQAEVMVNQAVGFAYSRPTGEDGEELFTSMRSFGHSSARPLAKQERKKGEFCESSAAWISSYDLTDAIDLAHRMVKVAAMLLERMKGISLPITRGREIQFEMNICLRFWTFYSEQGCQGPKTNCSWSLEGCCPIASPFDQMRSVPRRHPGDHAACGQAFSTFRLPSTR